MKIKKKIIVFHKISLISDKNYFYIPYGMMLQYFNSKLSFAIGFPGGSEGKASVYYAGDLSSIPGSGRSPGEGNGNPLQYSCLENPMV